MLIPVLTGLGTGLLTLATTLVLQHYKYREKQDSRRNSRDNRMERIAVGKAEEIDQRIEAFMDRQEAEIARLGLKIIEQEKRMNAQDVMIETCNRERGELWEELSDVRAELAKLKGAA